MAVVAECKRGEFLMVDYLVTDTELTNIANAIRTKAGGSSPLEFPTEFVSTINNIPVKTASVPPNDVNFIDYDGSIIASYSAADFANLSALPANPTHEGLIAQGWNWTLSDAKTYVTKYGFLDIGQNYDTDDGSLRLYVEVPESASAQVGLAFRVYGSGDNVTVDWGDGSVDTITSSSGTPQHTYSNRGNYVIKIQIPSTRYLSGFGSSRGLVYTPTSGRLLIKKAELSSRWKPNTSSAYGYEFNNCKNLETITIPNKANDLNYYRISYNMFSSCMNLKAAVIPSGAYMKLGAVFDNCYTIGRISMPKSLVDNSMAGSYKFRNCYLLKRITIPTGLTSIESSCFSACTSLLKVVIPEDITTIAASAFSGCSNLREIHFKASTPPTVANSNAWTSLPTDCVIYVPSGYLSAYTSASNYPSSSTYTYIEE